MKVSHLIKRIQVSSIIGLSLGLPNLIHIHIYITYIDTDLQHCRVGRCRVASLVAYRKYFIEELVRNLTNYPGLAGRGCLPAELIQVESRMCKSRWVEEGHWGYEVATPSSCGLKPLRVRRRDQRSRVGCDICFAPL